MKLSGLPGLFLLSLAYPASAIFRLDHTHSPASKQCGFSMLDQKFKQDDYRGDLVMSQQQDHAKRGAASWTPFQMVVDYSYLNLADANQKEYLTTKAIPTAINWFQNVLQVQNTSYGFSFPMQGTKDANGNFISLSPVTCYVNTIPDKYYAPYTYCPSGQPCQSRGGAGVNGHFVVLVTADNDPACQQGALAFANLCYQDKATDRPVAGFINLCPNYLSQPVDEMAWGGFVDTVTHEMTHALAFSWNLFRYFRDANGNPLTPRNSAGQPGSSPSTTTTVISPIERGNYVYKLILPKTLAAARAHFNCPTLNGVELEQQGGGGSALSHLESRIYNKDYMAPEWVIGQVQSPISLAVFEDSGWYKVDYSYTQTMPFGNGKGCSFAMNQCLTATNPPVVTFTDHWCTTPGAVACTPKRESRGFCLLGRYPTRLPTQFQFFAADTRFAKTDRPFIGSYDMFPDYCPTYMPQSPWDEYDCRFAGNALRQTYDYKSGGESFGGGSICLNSDLTNNASQTKNYVGRCYQTQCVSTANGFKLNIIIGGQLLVDCGTVGNKVVTINAAGFTGKIECPKVADVCSAASCPNNCNNIGKCLPNGVCQCKPGFSGVDCSLSAFTPDDVLAKANVQPPAVPTGLTTIVA